MMDREIHGTIQKCSREDLEDFVTWKHLETMATWMKYWRILQIHQLVTRASLFFFHAISH